MGLKVVVDRGVVGAAEAFGGLGEVRLLPAVEMSPDTLRDADVLVCRSTIRVGRELLDGSRVGFVATATIGIDHLDIPYLESNGIGWASAPACNADSVVQWVAAALLLMAARTERELGELRVGIVGVGAVGSRVQKLLAAAGLPAPLLCDPPRARRESAVFSTLDALLPEVDVLTLHVPLLTSGPDVTVRLLHQQRLGAMRPHAWVFNASRGEVVDGNALEAALVAGHLGGAVLDVWEGEPTPPPSLVRACAAATPHIAGHSLEGKFNGTKQAYDAVCAYLGLRATWQPTLPATAPLSLSPRDKSDAALILEAAAAGYRLDDDSQALVKIVGLPEGEVGAAFRRYRQNYPERRELSSFILTFNPPCERVPEGLAALGARVC